MKAHEILNTAAGHLEERGKVYDKPEGERSMPNVVVAFSAITGVTMTAEQGWLFMTLVKAVRSQQGDYKGDNYEDGAAYFALMGEQAEQDRASPFPGTHLDFDEARADAIGQNGNDGEHYDDMTNPANWRAGDLVECVSRAGTGEPEFFTNGVIYRLVETDGSLMYLYNDDEGDKIFANNAAFRFHSRPSADGWIEWAGGECPCDENSRVEIERKIGLKVQAAARFFDWIHTGSPSDIIRYRML